MTEGKRKELNESWDLIPGLFYSLGKVAEVANYGAYRAGPDGKGYGVGNWEGIEPTGTKCPLNHAFRHLAKATTFKIGDPEREWQLAKAAWNVLAQIALEGKFMPQDGGRKKPFVEPELPVTNAPLPPKPSDYGLVPSDKHGDPLASLDPSSDCRLGARPQWCPPPIIPDHPDPYFHGRDPLPYSDDAESQEAIDEERASYASRWAEKGTAGPLSIPTQYSRIGTLTKAPPPRTSTMTT